jgi:predicted RND superfamily exporter protein
MFEKITAFFAAHEPTSEEAIVIIRRAIKLLTPTEFAELKMIIASMEQAEKVVDVAIAPADIVTPPATL